MTRSRRHPDLGVWSDFFAGVRAETAASKIVKTELSARARAFEVQFPTPDRHSVLKIRRRSQKPRDSPATPERRRPRLSPSPPSRPPPPNFEFERKQPNRDRWPVRDVTYTSRRVFCPEWLSDYPVTPREVDIPCILGSPATDAPSGRRPHGSARADIPI